MSELAWVARVLLVLGLLGGALFYLRRTQAVSNSRRGATVQLLGSVRLSKGASVAVVRVGSARYALGVTDRSVTLLSDAVHLEDDSRETRSSVRVNSALQPGRGRADAGVVATPGALAEPADPAVATSAAAETGTGFRAELVRQIERQLAHRRPAGRPEARPDAVTDGPVTAPGPSAGTPQRTDAPASPEEQPCPVPRPRSLTAAAPASTPLAGPEPDGASTAPGTTAAPPTSEPTEPTEPTAGTTPAPAAAPEPGTERSA